MGKKTDPNSAYAIAKRKKHMKYTNEVACRICDTFERYVSKRSCVYCQQFGRKAFLDDGDRAGIVELFNASFTAKQIASKLGLKHALVSRFLVESNLLPEYVIDNNGRKSWTNLEICRERKKTLLNMNREAVK